SIAAHRPNVVFISLCGEPIADRWFRQQVARAGGIGFKFVAKLAHINSEILCFCGILWPPDDLEELALCNYFAGMLDQCDQQLVFDWRQMDFVVGDKHLPAPRPTRRSPSVKIVSFVLWVVRAACR